MRAILKTARGIQVQIHVIFEVLEVIKKPSFQAQNPERSITSSKRPSKTEHF